MDIPLCWSVQQECGGCAVQPLTRCRFKVRVRWSGVMCIVYCVMHVCSVGIHLLGISVAAWEGLRCLVTQPLANKTLSIPQRTRHSVAHGWVSRCLQVGMNGADGAGDWPDTELQLPHQMAPPARPRLQCCRHTANLQRTTKFRSSFHNIWSASAFTLPNLLKQYYEWIVNAL